MSLVNHGSDSFDCLHYASDMFDSNTGIWWHFDDEKITQMSDFIKMCYIRESHNKTKNRIKAMSVSTYVLFVVYIRTRYLTKYSSIFVQEFTNMSKINHMKKVIEYLNVFRNYLRVRQDVSDEFKTSIYFIKDELQTSIETNISCDQRKLNHFG